MSEEYNVTSNKVVEVKFIEVASWHKRAWDLGRKNIITISPQKISFLSFVVRKLLFLTLFGFNMFNGNGCSSRSRKRIYTMQKVYLNQGGTSRILFIHVNNKNNVGGLFNSNNYFLMGHLISIKNIMMQYILLH